MDGKRSIEIGREKPIAKPDYPLPAQFTPSKKSEFTTRRQESDHASQVERAHFYKKRTSPSGSPVYSFYITTEPNERAAGKS